MSVADRGGNNEMDCFLFDYNWLNISGVCCRCKGVQKTFV